MGEKHETVKQVRAGINRADGIIRKANKQRTLAKGRLRSAVAREDGLAPCRHCGSHDVGYFEMYSDKPWMIWALEAEMRNVHEKIDPDCAPGAIIVICRNCRMRTGPEGSKKIARRAWIRRPTV